MGVDRHGSDLRKCRRTLGILRLAEEHTWLQAENDGAIRRRNVRHTMAQIPLEFVHVVWALATTASVLTVDRVDA